MNSETDSPTPPRRFNKRRKETSVTPAIGDSTSGGLISISRILNGLISVISGLPQKAQKAQEICLKSWAPIPPHEEFGA
jgi:hypothetical protein